MVHGHSTYQIHSRVLDLDIGLGHRKGMVIGSFNVNSLLLHIDEIRTLVKDLDENIHDDLVSIEGYTIRRRDRNRHGGGVAIYIWDSIYDKCKLHNDIPVSSWTPYVWKSSQCELPLSSFWPGIAP